MSSQMGFLRVIKPTLVASSPLGPSWLLWAPCFTSLTLGVPWRCLALSSFQAGWGTSLCPVLAHVSHRHPRGCLWEVGHSGLFICSKYFPALKELCLKTTDGTLWIWLVPLLYAIKKTEDAFAQNDLPLEAFKKLWKDEEKQRWVWKLWWSERNDPALQRAFHSFCLVTSQEAAASPCHGVSPALEVLKENWWTSRVGWSRVLRGLLQIAGWEKSWGENGLKGTFECYLVAPRVLGRDSSH